MAKKEKELYIISYSHRHGVDTWLVRADHEPTEEEIITASLLDFEPDNEYIDIIRVTKYNTVEI